MFDSLKRLSLAALFAAAFVATPLIAADAPVKDAPAKDAPKPPVKAPAAKESAVEPKPRDAGWMKRHEAYLAENKLVQGKVDLLFVGDSITDGWHRKDKRPIFKDSKEMETAAPLDLFNQAWGAYKPFNTGLGGDRTQHVIWRLQNGEVAGISPKLAVVMIGTNNLGGNTNEEIVAGIKGVVVELHKQLPTTKVLLLGIFPRSAKPADAARGRIKAINDEIAKWDDAGKTLKYLDIGAKFLDADGNLTKEIMPDALHPNAKGYQIWIDATKPTVEAMLK